VKPDAATSWADRRVEILQRACRLISKQLKSGTSRGRAIEFAAQKFHNSDLGNGHRLKLSERNMRLLWRKWQERQDASSLRLKHPVNPRSVVADPMLLRLIVEHCLQNGVSLSRAVEVFRRRGASVSISRVCRALNAPAVASFARSQRDLIKRRKKLEERFFQAGLRANRKFLKKLDALLRGVLQRHSQLQRRLLQHRDFLQRKFLAADARAVRQREELQRKMLRSV
jgi:hypothetical protein